MDKEQKKDWSWLPKAMPGVTKLMAEKRQKLGDAHVRECWRRGVVLGEPDSFFAREGALAIGTPFAADPVLAGWQSQAIGSGAALVLMASPKNASEVQHA